MKVDYHIHTKLCGHASGQMRQYVEAAIEAGIEKMGFSDHTPLYHLPLEQRDPGLAMCEEQMAGYVDSVLALKEEYQGQIEIALGFEADFIPGFEDELERILNLFPVDYIYGSIHFLGDWAFDSPYLKERYNQWDPDRLYDLYFDTLCQAARSGFFDIMAHPDLIKKFDYWPKGHLEPYWERAAAAFKEGKVAIELNSSGWRRQVAQAYPHPGFLKYCSRAGVPVTFGSDAHSPGEVGLDWQKGVETLRAAGYNRIATFCQRRYQLEPLGV
jgi:histidinol-phosphatase (PHP family)